MVFDERTGFLVFEGIKKDTSELVDILGSDTKKTIASNEKLQKEVISSISKNKNTVTIDTKNDNSKLDLSDKTLSKLTERRIKQEEKVKAKADANGMFRDSKGKFLSKEELEKQGLKNPETAKEKLEKEKANNTATSEKLEIDASGLLNVADTMGEAYSESFKEIFGLFSGLEGIVKAPLNLYNKFFGKKETDNPQVVAIDSAKEEIVTSLNDNKKSPKTPAQAKDIVLEEEKTSKGEEARDKRATRKTQRSDKKRNKLLSDSTKGSGLLVGAMSGFDDLLGGLPSTLSDGFKGIFGSSTDASIPTSGKSTPKRGIASKAGGLLGKAGGLATKGASLLPMLANPVGLAVAGVGALAYGGYKLYDNMRGSDKSKEIFDKLEDDGVINHNIIGKSEVLNWNAVESLKVKALKDLIAYDDWDKNTKDKMQTILDKKEGTKKNKPKAVKTKEKKSIVSSSSNIPTEQSSTSGVVNFEGKEVAVSSKQMEMLQDLQEQGQGQKVVELMSLLSAEQNKPSVATLSSPMPTIKSPIKKVEEETKISKSNVRDNENDMASKKNTPIVVNNNNTDVVDAIKKLGKTIDKSIVDNKTTTENIISHTPERRSIEDNL